MKEIRKILNDAWSLYCRHFGLWIKTVAFFIIPLLLVKTFVIFWLANQDDDVSALLLPADVKILLIAMGTGMVVVLLLLFLVELELLIFATVRPDRLSAKTVYAEAVRRWPGYVWIKIRTLGRFFVKALLLIVPGAIQGMKDCFAGMAYLYDGHQGNAAFDFSVRIVTPVLRLFVLFLLILATQTFVMFNVINQVMDFLIRWALTPRWTWAGWILDLLKGYFYGVVIVFPLIAGYYFYHWAKQLSEGGPTGDLHEKRN
jgi:hypothetical protein